MKCAVCSAPETKRYRMGSVRGHLCAACTKSAGDTLTAWTERRMHEVVLAHVLSAEQLPISTRRRVRERGAT